jgi:hypothetical protein
MEWLIRRKQTPERLIFAKYLLLLKDT